MKLLITTLIAIAVREGNKDNTNIAQIANGVIAASLVSSLIKPDAV